LLDGGWTEREKKKKKKKKDTITKPNGVTGVGTTGVCVEEKDPSGWSQHKENRGVRKKTGGRTRKGRNTGCINKIKAGREKRQKINRTAHHNKKVTSKLVKRVPGGGEKKNNGKKKKFPYKTIRTHPQKNYQRGRGSKGGGNLESNRLGWQQRPKEQKDRTTEGFYREGLVKGISNEFDQAEGGKKVSRKGGSHRMGTPRECWDGKPKVYRSNRPSGDMIHIRTS